MTVYTKTMMEALVEVRGIKSEATMNPDMIAKLKKAYEPMRDKKISVSNANKLSALMDKFAKNKDVLLQLVKADIPFVSTAAVTKLISKHGMKGAEINKFKKEEMEFWAELDEGKEKDARQLVDPNKEVLVVKKNEVVVIDKKDQDKYLKKGWSLAEETELDEKTKWKMGDGRPRGGAYIENERFWDLDIDALKYIMKDADTAMKANPTGRKAGKYADEVNDAHTVIGWRKKNGIKEEVEVDKNKLPDMRDALMQVRSEKPIQLDEQLSKIKGNTPADQGRRGAVEDDIERAEKKGDKKLVAKLKEDEELDEGKMKELHGYIEAGKSAEWIAKKMGVDVKTIKALMSEAYELGTDEYLKHTQEVTPGEPKEVDEASARADAKRAMKSDPSMKQDPFSKDDEASPEDVKGAEKNIINQLRVLVSLKGIGKVQLTPQQKRNLKKKDSKYLKTLGSGFVQFGKGQEKVDIKVAQSILNKFNSLGRPADKEKFQAQVGKSYKDMLKMLKAGYNEEVELDEAKPEYEVKYAKSKTGPFNVTEFMTFYQAKEYLADLKKDGMNGIISKGGKPVKEETILDRIDKKLKERKNG